MADIGHDLLGHCQETLGGVIVLRATWTQERRCRPPDLGVSVPRDGGGRLSLPSVRAWWAVSPDRSPRGPEHATCSPRPGSLHHGECGAGRAVRLCAGSLLRSAYAGGRGPSRPTTSKSSLTGISRASATLKTLSNRGEKAPVSIR